MGMLGQARDMYRLQKEAKQIKKELANIHVEGETEGVSVTVNCEMAVISTKIPAEMKTPENSEKLDAALVSAANKALKKAQEIAAEKMKGVMSAMQGMMGGAQN